MAQQYHVVGKWHDNLVLPVPASALGGPYGRFFKTDEQTTSDIRTTSPGRIVLVSMINPPTGENVPMQIDLDWDVTLRGAAAPPTGRITPELIFSVPVTLRSNATADTAYDPLLQRADTSSYAAVKTQQSTLGDGDKKNLYYLPSPVTIIGNTGASGAPQAIVAHYICYKDLNAFSLYAQNLTDIYEITVDIFTAQPARGAAPVWPAGTRFPYARPAPSLPADKDWVDLDETQTSRYHSVEDVTERFRDTHMGTPAPRPLWERGLRYCAR